MAYGPGQSHAICYTSVETGPLGSAAPANGIINGAAPATAAAAAAPATTAAASPGITAAITPGGGNNASCPTPPAQICCTRLVSRSAGELSVGFAAEASLVSVTLSSQGAPLAWGADWTGLGVTLFSVDGGAERVNDCILVNDAAAAGPAPMPGYRTKSALCRVRGRRVLLRLPAGRLDELQVSLCVSESGPGTVDTKVHVQE